MSEQDEALRWAEYFCGVMRFVLALAPHMDDAEYWRGWLYAVDQDRLLYRLHNDARELLSDYRSRRVVAKVEHHQGELFPRVGFIVTNLSLPSRAVVRLQLSVLTYNLGNLWRRMLLPKRIDHWSLTSLQQRLVKTGERLVKHARYYWPLLAEGHLTRAGVRCDSPADLGAALAGGVSPGGYRPCEPMAKKKKEGRWSVGELGRDAPKLPVGSGPEGCRPLFIGTGKAPGDAL
jgi:hypothetical protein